MFTTIEQLVSLASNDLRHRLLALYERVPADRFEFLQYLRSAPDGQHYLPLPSGEAARPIYDLGLEIARRNKFQVVEFTEDELPHPLVAPGTEGQIDLLRNVIYLRRKNGTAMAHTMIHELAHMCSCRFIVESYYRWGWKSKWLHHAYNESLAESVAVLIMTELGHDVLDFSLPYLSGYDLSTVRAVIPDLENDVIATASALIAKLAETHLPTQVISAMTEVAA